MFHLDGLKNLWVFSKLHKFIQSLNELFASKKQLSNKRLLSAPPPHFHYNLLFFLSIRIYSKFF
jgi:hypothetical protein